MDHDIIQKEADRLAEFLREKAEAAEREKAEGKAERENADKEQV